MEIIDVRTTAPAEIIARTCEVLQHGGLVLFPTETVYGAGVDATNQAAVDKLLAYKSRREGKPLSIACADSEMAERYVEVNAAAQELYRQFLPGPVTIVSRSLGAVAKGVASEFGTLGVRIPAYPLILDLVRAYGIPLTATSANASGKKSPYHLAGILEDLSQKQRDLIDLVLDAGELPRRPPSTVIDTTLSTPTTLRAGEVDFGTGPTTTLVSASEDETKTIAGRLLLKHWNDVQERGLVIGLLGSLGVGKTIFAKGVAEFLGIHETLTSPTYTYIEEYPYHRHTTSGTLYHLDVWKVESREAFERLECTKLLRPGNIILVEWWNLIAEYQALAGADPQPAFFQVVFEEKTAAEAPQPIRQLTISDTSS